MTTIEIIREQADKQNAVYRAICGEQQAAGVTPGEALDALERLLAMGGEEQEAGTVVIMQRFRPDAFFTEAQQMRLRELMDQFHAARDSCQEFPPEQKQELETLVHAEWQAAINRAEALLTETIADCGLNSQLEFIRTSSRNKEGKLATCRTCNGKGSVKCPKCKGSGRVSSGGILPGGSVQCDNCHGSGVARCGGCAGKGHT
jgi:hypothetical protein